MLTGPLLFHLFFLEVQNRKKEKQCLVRGCDQPKDNSGSQCHSSLLIQKGKQSHSLPSFLLHSLSHFLVFFLPYLGCAMFKSCACPFTPSQVPSTGLPSIDCPFLISLQFSVLTIQGLCLNEKKDEQITGYLSFLFFMDVPKGSPSVLSTSAAHPPKFMPHNSSVPTFEFLSRFFFSVFIHF